MRIVNPGFKALFTSYGNSVWEDNFYHYSLSADVKKKVNDKIIGLLGGLSHFLAPNCGQRYPYDVVSELKPSLMNMQLKESKNEIWVSFCSLVPYFNDSNCKDLTTARFFTVVFQGTNISVGLGRASDDKIDGYRLMSIASASHIASPGNDSMDFGSNKLIDQRGPAEIADTPIYVEIHLKTGNDGRLDVWINNKLEASYRSPTKLTGSITAINMYAMYDYQYSTPTIFHSFILQDTGRIGLERLKKLTVSPDTDQTMPQNSTTNFTLSGLSDATEFSDITSIVPVIRTTSKDANITEGTFSIDGAIIGTVDISDSSGKAVASTNSTINSVTSAPWTRDNIEGKTLSFKVNGAR